MTIPLAPRSVILHTATGGRSIGHNAIAVVIIILVRGCRTRPRGRRPNVARCRSEQSRDRNEPPRAGGHLN